MVRSVFWLLAFCCPFVSFAATASAQELTEAEARSALNRAVAFFRNEVAVQGGYVYFYSATDLTKREGEHKTGPATAWVQPPGTPAVGEAYLEAYRLTREAECLAAARETAEALLQGQLRSGGWARSFELERAERGSTNYRTEPANPKRKNNATSFDDNKSQSAVRFLMHLDQELAFADERVHEATLYALDCFVQAQFPNGAWPQQYSEFPNPAEYPVVRASYPDDWSRTFPKVTYQGHYTLNDNAMNDLIDVMLEAAAVYGDSRYRAAAEKGGDFFLLAQMPDPQPGWAQQYDAQMHPAWARKFEPPCISGGEGQSVISTLLKLYRATGQTRFLEPIPRALAYYKASRLPDGRMARFYELQTNRPLYFNRKYELNYSTENMATGYGYIVDYRLESVEQQYERLRQTPPDELEPLNYEPQREYRLTNSLKSQAREAVDGLDERGAWVEPGTLDTYGDDDNTTEIISSRTFAKNVGTLSKFIAAVQE